ncbi:MAG: WG repeat-containing protein [Myxococcales bacterium]|nr:WG repeat-containing protein [Myxococcales bacterium]
MRALILLCALSCLVAAPALADGDTAALQLWPVHKDGQMGFMNRAGELAIPARYDDVNPFHEGLARVKVGQTFTSYGAITGGAYGYIDAKGEWVIKAEYDWAHDFHEGLALVKRDKKRMYIDRTGKVVIPGDFHRAEDFHGGFAGVELRRDQWAYIDKQGKIAFHLPAGADNSDPARFSEGYVVVQFRRSKQDRGSWVFDTQGNKVLEIPHAIARDVKAGLIAVRDHTKSRWGFMDLSGKWVLPALYKFAWSFEGGRAQVTLEDGQVAFIDKAGKILLRSPFTRVGLFHEGLAKVDDEGERVAYMDEQGKLTVPFGRWVDPQNSMSSFTGGLALVRERKDKDIFEGYIDRAGTVVWAPTPTKWKPAKR